MTTPRTTRFTAETDLGPPVVEWLTAEGFEVYQEVEVGSIADVVGVRGPQFVVVEMKLSLSWELLAQARGWRWCTHQVWVAVPRAKSSSGRHTAIQCFEQMGVGVVEVDRLFDGTPFVREPDFRPADLSRLRPTWNRKADTSYLRKALREENRTVARAGSTSAARDWSDFKQTCRRVREYVVEHPGATITEVVKDVKHHYATDAGARAHLVKLIVDGKVPGLVCEWEGEKGPYRLYPDPPQASVSLKLVGEASST